MPLDSAPLSGRWLALCFPGSLHAGAIQCLNVQVDALAREGAVLLLVLSDARLFRLAGRNALQEFTVPIVTDPLNRLHRSYGVQRRPPFSHPATFLIDPDRILRLEIDHDFNGADLDALRELMEVKPDHNRSTGQTVAVPKGADHVMCAR